MFITMFDLVSLFLIIATLLVLYAFMVRKMRQQRRLYNLAVCKLVAQNDDLDAAFDIMDKQNAMIKLLLQ